MITSSVFNGAGCKMMLMVDVITSGGCNDN